MPYLQLFVPLGKSESEAQAILNYLRDNFPLKQSEGHVHRVAANFILFEQPEHTDLTLEQEVWLEKHGGEELARVGQGFWANRVCEVCKTPVDDSPTGFCPRCYATNPNLVTHLTLHFQSDEYPYVVFLCRHIWGSGIESPCLRTYLQAFLYLLEQEQLTVKGISQAGLERFKTGAQAYTHKARTTCSNCGLPKEQCDCANFPALQFSDDLESHEVNVPISREDYRKLQAFAEQRGMDVETFALCALGMPEVQLAAASREAALGRIFNCQMDLQLKGPETKARSTTAVIGTESFNPSLFHLVNMCLSLIDAAPMLETSLLDILYGLRREPQNGLSLAQQKKQLAVIDAPVAQTAMSCTAGEVKALEQQIGYALPVAYKEFLTWMGHGAGSFLRYLDCFYPSLAPLQQTARAMLTTDACRSTLADDAFVFTLISGEGFAFIRTSEGDDPPVYAHRRVWRNVPFRKIYHRFSDLITVQLGLYTELRRPRIFQGVPGVESRRRYQAMTPKIQAAAAQKVQEMQENR